MKILIVEDEHMAQAALARTLTSTWPEIEVIGMSDSVSGTVEFLRSDKAASLDVIFMDVELADGNCFEIFRQVEVTQLVVMTTAYDHYAIKAFEAGSIDYLLKPIDQAALRRAVERCFSRLGTAGAPAASKTFKERLTVRIGDMTIPVETSSIAYFYSEDKANYLVTADGTRFIIDLSMETLAEELDPEQFFRISRGGIVARKAVRTVHRHLSGRLRLECTPVPPFEMTVSRSRVQDFLAWLQA